MEAVPNSPYRTGIGYTKLSLLLALISLLVFANSFRNGFAVDDSTVIVNNNMVRKGISAIPELLSTPYREGFRNDQNDLYRPLSLVMFAIEYQLFDQRPEPMHVVNVLIFMGCIVLLFSFTHRFFDGNKPAVAFIAALLFALHPIHTEVVDNIKSRDELLCFFFAFLSLNLMMRYAVTGKAWQLTGGAFCFLLAFLARETAVTFVVLVPLIFFFYRNENRRRSVFITASVVAVAAGLLAVRFAILSHYHAGDLSKTMMLDNVLATPGLPAHQKFATIIYIMGYYLKLMLVPYPLIWDYSYNTIPVTHFSDPFVLISLAAYIFLLYFSISRLLQKRKDPVAFGILFFMVSISLFSNLLFLVGVTMAERFLFIPSVGFCLVAAVLAERLLIKGSSILKQPKLLAVLAPICVVFAVLTYCRNSDWVDNYTLYTSDVQKAPNSARINYLLGDELILEVVKHETDAARQKQIRAAGISYLKKALRIYPDYMGAENYLGFAYLNNGEYDSAEVHSERALALDPANTSLAGNLAGLYVMNKKYPKAISLFNKLLTANPNDAVAYANLGICYGNLRAYDSSEYCAKKAITLEPGNPSMYMVLITTYQLSGKTDSAKKYEQIAGVRSN